MNIFISGGCKNGKSYHAQMLAKEMAGMAAGENAPAPGKGLTASGQPASCAGASAAGLPLYYLATMIPVDDEDRARIQRHLAEREGWGFDTIERGFDICDCLKDRTVSGQEVDPAGVFLLDSVTALLANEMFRPDGSVDADAPKRLAEDLVRFAHLTGNTVFVSDFIYADPRIDADLTEDYRRGLAHIDKALAKACDRVLEVSYGTVNQYK